MERTLEVRILTLILNKYDNKEGLPRLPGAECSGVAEAHEFSAVMATEDEPEGSEGAVHN